ncbi:MAG: homocysteine S-methyltransferase family protein [Oscillospiraceae bacterium]|nr:homocysteine S-methyltransferase family protein [Oscillospiraceae bacterium]
MKQLTQRLGKEWLFCDGGSGTYLQEHGLAGGELPETWNLSRPDIIEKMNRSYYEAGADIVNTNTFGANVLKFGDKTDEIITAGVNIAKRARHAAGRDDDAYVALDIGPTGKLLEPMGDLSFDRAVEIFAQIVRAGAAEGADLVLIETMSDGYEAKAALLAAKENCTLPVIVTCVYDNNGRLLTGGTVETTVAMLEGLGADAVGVNCGVGPDMMVPIVERLVKCASVPVVVNPNAGLPQVADGKTVFNVGPEEFVQHMSVIARMGVQVCGGCCGTTPDHIRLLSDTVRELPFIPQTEKDICIVTSGSRGVVIGDRTVIIGERINPTGKKRFKQALRENDIPYILGEGLKQETQGAHILDVNVGLPEIDEPEMMERVVKALQEVTPLPLQIDTTDVKALERAMRIYNGKPMINSVNGKKEVIEQVMPLVAKYGGVLVSLALDEDGIPDNADDRIRIARRIYEAAEHYGIPRRDIVIDGLCMTVSSDTSSALATLETVRRVRDELHGHSILGVSNISFGLPARELVNSTFLTMAMQNGLSCAIINPGNEPMMRAYFSTNALLNKDPQCMDFVGRYSEYVAFDKQGSTQAQAAGDKPQTGAASGETATVAEAVKRGFKAQAEELTRKALKTSPALEIIDRELIPALDEVGVGFEKGRVFLPQLLMSADAAKAAFEVIKTSMAGQEQQIKAKVILATVKGDIHDIGKNIVKVMMENYGYQVIDLGKDVPPEVIVDTAIKEDIKLVWLSALMTTTVVSMEETIKLLREKKPDCKVAVGGAVMTQEYADAIGADFYGKDAMATVRYADSLFC